MYCKINDHTRHAEMMISGEIVEYDVCAEIPINNKTLKSYKKFRCIGIGKIYDIDGVRIISKTRYAFFKRK